jgi:hypothetical protein
MYGSPADPVALTVITVAWQVANVMTPLRWLRLMTGNADPPGANYVVVSDSTTGTAWKKIPADALAAGVVAANLGYVPANKAGDVFSGDVSALGFAAGAHGVSGGTGGFDTTGPYNGGSKILGAALKLIGLDIGTLGISNAGPYDGGTISDGDIAVQGASVGAHGVSSTGNIASAGNTSGFQLVSTVANYASPPIVVDPNQGGVPVPNLYAAKAQSADAATTAAQLAGVDASHYARKDAATDFTTVPTINGNGIIRTDTIGIQSVAAAIVAAVANSVQAGSVTDVGIAAGNKNGTAATFSMRKLGTGSTDAAAGDHTHVGLVSRLEDHNNPSAALTTSYVSKLSVTADRTGLFLINAAITFGVTAGDNLLTAALFVNGVQIYESFFHPTATVTSPGTVTVPIVASGSVTIGQVIEVKVKKLSGSGTSTYSAGVLTAV